MSGKEQEVPLLYLEVAKKHVQDIAVKAIERASEAKAFQIALEQTKGRPFTA